MQSHQWQIQNVGLGWGMGEWVIGKSDCLFSLFKNLRNSKTGFVSHITNWKHENINGLWAKYNHYQQSSQLKTIILSASKLN